MAQWELRMYREYLDGYLYHFKDNSSGDKVDAILEFSTGEYATIENKLSENVILESKKSLLKFYENVSKKT